MYLPPEVAVELQEDRPEPVCDHDGIGSSRRCFDHGEIVNQVNSFAAPGRVYRARVSRRRGKNLVLIVARELASNLETPVFIVDAEGTVVFYNEPAEAIIGRAYSELGEIPGDEWRSLFEPETIEGRLMALDEMPSAIAFRERRPAHGTFTIEGVDGVRRQVSATGLPLFARGREFVGVVTIFWERDGTEEG